MSIITKNYVVAYLTIFLCFFMIVSFINNCTGRSFRDGIEKSELHHMLTGEYYNEYKIISADSTYIKIDSAATFQEIYWDDLPIIIVE